MKLVIAWLAALTIAGVTWVACAIPHKSTDYECTTQDDCAALPGRVCSGGFCVVTNGPVIDAGRPDAPRPPTDAPMAVCPAQCTSCDVSGKVCEIDCAVTSCTANAPIVCPTGWNCDIACSTPNSCRGGINCTTAASCTIGCTGVGSCRSIGCGAGACAISCEGDNSCRGINCAQACACDVKCGDGADCEAITCKQVQAFQCGVFGGGCTSERIGCDTCP